MGRRTRAATKNASAEGRLSTDTEGEDVAEKIDTTGQEDIKPKRAYKHVDPYFQHHNNGKVYEYIPRPSLDQNVKHEKKVNDTRETAHLVATFGLFWINVALRSLVISQGETNPYYTRSWVLLTICPALQFLAFVLSIMARWTASSCKKNRKWRKKIVPDATPKEVEEAKDTLKYFYKNFEGRIRKHHIESWLELTQNEGTFHPIMRNFSDLETDMGELMADVDEAKRQEGIIIDRVEKQSKLSLVFYLLYLFNLFVAVHVINRLPICADTS